jgi:hypothetical protein
VVYHVALICKLVSTITTFKRLRFIMFSKVVSYIGAFIKCHSAVLIQTEISGFEFVRFRIYCFYLPKPIAWDARKLLVIFIAQ